MNELNPLTCPLCAEPNHCGFAQGLTDCWCRHVQIPIRRLMQIPPAFINKACICQTCAMAPLQNRSPLPHSHPRTSA
ncbi:MAG: cysteine-rich CWC family protein [Verrucomicrobiota bacterium]